MTARPDFKKADPAVLRAVPGLRAPLMKVAGMKVQRLLGFWALWHAFGGLDGLIGSGVISRAGVYTQRKEFRDVFGVDVADLWPDVGDGLRSGATSR